MRVSNLLLAAALAAGFSVESASAAPAVPDKSNREIIIAEIPFDPPLDSNVRFRSEKAVQKDGATELRWSLNEYRFEQTDSGYRLTIIPISYGSNETDPLELAMMKRLEELTRRPYVLRLSSAGEIEEMENADLYWSTMFGVLRDEIAGNATGQEGSRFRAIVENLSAMFERMPAEARLALLTEDVQPVIEFANTRTEVGRPISDSVEGPSPFGGVIRREVTISLQKVMDAKAFVRISSTIPRAELDKLVQAFLKQLTTLPAEKRKEAEIAMTSVEGFRHDTLGEYEVSVEDGLLERYQSTETIEVHENGERSQKVTTRSMVRVR